MGSSQGSWGGAAGSGQGWEAAGKVLEEALSAHDSALGIHLPENQCQSGIRAPSAGLGTHTHAVWKTGS